MGQHESKSSTGFKSNRKTGTSNLETTGNPKCSQRMQIPRADTGTQNITNNPNHLLLGDLKSSVEDVSYHLREETLLPSLKYRTSDLPNQPQDSGFGYPPTNQPDNGKPSVQHKISTEALVAESSGEEECQQLPSSSTNSQLREKEKINQCLPLSSNQMKLDQRQSFESTTNKTTNESSLKNISTSGAPLLPSTTQEKSVKNVLDTNTSGQHMMIPLHQLDKSDRSYLKSNKIPQVEVKKISAEVTGSVEPPNYVDMKGLNVSYSTEHDISVDENTADLNQSLKISNKDVTIDKELKYFHDTAEKISGSAYKNKSREDSGGFEHAEHISFDKNVADLSEPFRFASLKTSTKDITIDKALKHFDSIAEKITGSADNKPRKETDGPEHANITSKAKCKQFLRSCSVKMRNVTNNDQKLLLSLQTDILSILREMEQFTSALKTFPVFSSEIFSSSEIIIENLIATRKNYEVKRCQGINLFLSSQSKNFVIHNQNQQMNYFPWNVHANTIASTLDPTNNVKMQESVDSGVNVTHSKNKDKFKVTDATNGSDVSAISTTSDSDISASNSAAMTKLVRVELTETLNDAEVKITDKETVYKGTVLNNFDLSSPNNMNVASDASEIEKLNNVGVTNPLNELMHSEINLTDKPNGRADNVKVIANKISMDPLRVLLDQLPAIFSGEKNYISLRNNQLYCALCKKPVTLDVNNLIEHLKGKHHSALSKALNEPKSVPQLVIPDSSKSPDLSVLNKTDSLPKPQCVPDAYQEERLVMNTNSQPNYKGVLDLISNSIASGLHFDVNVYICLWCDLLENDKDKAYCHVRTEHKDAINSTWHYCKTCAINIYGTNFHFLDHCSDKYHISIFKIKGENPEDQMNEKLISDTTLLTDDQASVCSESSNRSQTRMTSHTSDTTLLTDDQASVCSESSNRSCTRMTTRTSDQASICSESSNRSLTRMTTRTSDQASICSESSNKSRTRMTTHEILLSIAKQKKIKNQNLKGPFGLYCQVCKKYDVSESFINHLETSKHKNLCDERIRSVRQKISLGLEKCSACDVHLFGDKTVWREHESLQLHKEFVALKKKEKSISGYVASIQNTENVCKSIPQEAHTSNTISLNLNSSESRIMSPQLSPMDQLGPHYELMKIVLRKRISNDSDKVLFGVYCHFCQIFCLDESPVESHLQNTLHKKNIDSLQISENIQYCCRICNIILMCDKQFFSTHLQSLAHTAIERLLITRNKSEEVEGTICSDDESELSFSDNESENADNLSQTDFAKESINEVQEKIVSKNKDEAFGLTFKGLHPAVSRRDVDEYFKKFGTLRYLNFDKKRGNGAAFYINEEDRKKVLQRTNFIRGLRVEVHPIKERRRRRKDQKSADQIVKLHPRINDMMSSKTNLETAVSGLLSEMQENYDANNQKRMKIHQDLVATMPGCKVLFFGSQVTRLATNKSDFDIYIDHDGKSFYNNLSYDKQSNIIHHLVDKLSRPGSQFALREVILEARVPIIRVSHIKTKTKCDISFRNGLAVENSQLIKLYLDMDPRARWLVVAIKFWMEMNGLLDRSVFTSYATVWLTLFCLMRLQEPVVCPVKTLQRNCDPHFVARWDCRFHRNLKNVSLYFRTHNRHSNLQLLSAFFEMYATFPFQSKVMCPLNGKIIHREQFNSLTLPQEFKPYLDKSVSRLSRLQNRFSLSTNVLGDVMGVAGCEFRCSQDWEKLKTQTPICLQDPFDLSHNVTKGVCRSDLKRFQALCHKSYEMCQALLANK